MHDPRKPRPLKPRALAAMVLDASTFTRGLICEILRNVDVSNVWPARDSARACEIFGEQPIDVILVSWEEHDDWDALGFIAAIRRLNDDRLRRLPIVFVTSGITRQLVLKGRDAGVDEFLAKPISPVALRQRLEMVIQTPRPFVDCAVYLGPCRRRKNPADYHGAKRRTGEREVDAPMVDADEVEANQPIRVALASLRSACGRLRAGDPRTLMEAATHMKASRTIAMASNDKALLSALAAFEAYISVAAPLGKVEENVTSNALSALEQLAALPQGYTDARDSVAIALGRAIQKKLAA